jgi:hypothetical protein
MAGRRDRRSVRPTIERLESREVPANTHWLAESFDTTAVGALPSGWSQSSSGAGAPFAVSAAAAASAPNSLIVSTAASGAAAQAWYNPTASADVQVTTSVLLNTLISAQVLARGSGLGTATPSYYAVTVTRGLEVDLVRVVSGASTTLAQLTSAGWYSDRWTQVTLSVTGTNLKAQVYRPDTLQYLNAAGQWQSAQAWALSVTDGAITSAGQVGVARAPSYAGTVAFDDFTADLLGPLPSSPPPPTPVTVTESFDTTPVGSLPSGWAQWNSGGGSFAVSAARALSAPNGLSLFTQASGLAAYAWQTTAQTADVQAGAAVYLDTLIPALVLARGTGLGTASPSYYAVAVTRGLEVDLVRVVNGTSSTLARLTSAGWFSDAWVRITLSVSGSSLQAQVVRADTGQYLNAAGQWQAAQTWALTATDTALPGAGQVGVARPPSYAGTLTFDDFTATSLSAPPSPPPPVTTVEAFDTTTPGALPTGWTQWNSGGGAFAVSPARALSAPNGLTVTTTASGLTAYAWETSSQPANVTVGAAVYLNTLIPAEVFARGTGLGTATPSYYALAITRGLEVDLVRVVNGASTTLARLTSAGWFSDAWVRVTLAVAGTGLKAQVFRPDTAQYLDPNGQWQPTQAWALTATDSTLTGAGVVGVGRPPSYAGTLTFDDFTVTPSGADAQPPTVAIAAPAAGAVLTGVATVQVTATDPGGVAKVEFYVDNVLRATSTAVPYQWSFDTSTAANGAHTLLVKAYDLAGNVAQASQPFTAQNNTALPRPVIPQHYPNIRIAELAYAGTPIGSFEDQLLQTSVDLVIPDPVYASQIHAVAPATPQLTYTNLSNLYSNLLTSWLNYAAANSLDPEGAFYHVSQATPFSGNSPSSQPVTWFWAVTRVGTTTTDVTGQANGILAGGVKFGAAGESLAVAYPEPFRLINVRLTSAPTGGWSYALEYPSAVDANGNPTAWSPLPTLTDTTNRLTQAGQLTFDPPADWKMATVNGSARMYYVRFRTVTAGTPPVAATILGDDYVHAGGTTSGVIPAFDYAADTNHDGYLNDAEYAQRTPGMDARFAYQGRMFEPGYGQMRFATNPSYVGYRNWAIAFGVSYLNSQPLAAGLFVDNSSGIPPVSAGQVIEPVASYTADYAALLNAVGQAVAPRWLLANTAQGSASDQVAQKVQGYFDEFAIRPLSQTFQQFEDVAAMVSTRAALQSPAPYAVLDSYPDGGSPTDPRTQIATLAYYYLIADPSNTFLDFYGGAEPATTWSRHWVPAAAYNIGPAAGPWSVFATGADPANPTLTFRVYQRAFSNALVLYKPLSAGTNGTTGTTADGTATTFALNGSYRILNADNTLGPVVTSITLRNGEGAILIKS